MKYDTKVNYMSDEIKIHKNTGLLLVGLLLAMVVGGYVVFGSSADVTTSISNTPTNQQSPPSKLTESSGSSQTPGSSGQAQEVYLKATGAGYDKSEITVKKGVPVRLHFTAQNAGCGSQLVIYGLNVKALSRGQETVVEFTPTQEGTYQYSCGMRMFPPGKFVVTA